MPKINLISRSRRLEVIMAKSLTTPTLKSIVMKWESNMSSPQHTHPTKWGCRKKEPNIDHLGKNNA